MNTQQLADVIRARRQELRVDQATVAQLADVATHTVSNIEQGEGNPTLRVLARVLDVLGLELVIRPKPEGEVS